MLKQDAAATDDDATAVVDAHDAAGDDQDAC